MVSTVEIDNENEYISLRRLGFFKELLDTDVDIKIDNINKNFINSLADEKTRAELKETELLKSLTEEIARSKGAEIELQGKLEAEIAQRELSNINLSDKIQDTVSSLNQNIDSRINDVNKQITEETDVLQTQLTKEIELRASADTALDARLNNIENLSETVDQINEKLKDLDNTSSQVFIGTYEEYLEAFKAGRIPTGMLVVILDENSTDTSAILGTAILGKMILGQS